MRGVTTQAWVGHRGAAKGQGGVTHEMVETGCDCLPVWPAPRSVFLCLSHLRHGCDHGASGPCVRVYMRRVMSPETVPHEHD